MNPQDFDLLGKRVYENLENINRYLGKAKFVSQFHSNEGGTDLPSMLLALTKEEEPHPITGTNELDPLERPSEEEIDALFATIRSHSITGSKGHQRQGSFKKTNLIPAQQSRLLNETNLVANATTMTGSFSDLTSITNKTLSHPKPPPVDVEAMVDRFRKGIDSLAKIENRKIQSVDLMQSRKLFRQEWESIGKTCRNVESLLDHCEGQLECNGEKVIKKEPLISNDFVKSLKTLHSKLHYTAYIKKSENLPDLTKTLSMETFPLAECLDAIDETIRRKKL